MTSPGSASGPPAVSSDAAERYDRLAERFAGVPGVTLPGQGGGRGFGASALKAHGAIFAMLTRGRLVVKLPRQRVRELVADGTGEPFDAGKGRPLKEWLSVAVEDERTWLALAREALAYGSRDASG